MKHTMTLTLGLALLGVGCGGSQKPPTAAAPTCADAAAHADAVIAADETEGAGAAELAVGVRALVVERCPADGWSAEPIACITGAATHDALHGCLEQLSPEQLQRFRDGIQELRAHGAEGDTMMKDAPPPPPPPPSRSRPPSDPCGGDE